MSASSILVRVVSYRDPELLRTVASAWEQADRPERIRFAIVQQFGPETAEQLEPLRGDPRVRVFRTEWSSARGLGWARRMTDRMRVDESFALQIDAHTRFAPGWDTALIDRWESLDDPRAVLSCYPGAFTPLDEHRVELREAGPHLIVPAGTDQYGLPRQDGGPAASAGATGLLVSGGFQFSAGALCSELEQVRDVMIADEYVQALRLFTHGWNVRAPGSVPLFHLYRRDRPHDAHGFARDFASTPDTAAAAERLIARSLATARAIISGDGAGALGAVRSRQEFEERLRGLTANPSDYS